MFKTAPKIDTRNPERNVFTPIAKLARRVKISLDEKVEEEQQHEHRLSQLRPMTTPLVQRKQYSTTLQQSTHNSHLVNMRSMGGVQAELQSTYKGQMCDYLKIKLRRLVDKRKEEMVLSRYLDQPIQNEMESTIKSSVVGPLDHFYSTFRKSSRLKIEKGIDQAYISNAKERISRLIQAKRQSQHHYNQLKLNVKTMIMHRDQRRSRTKRQHFRVASVDEQQWDRQWREQSRKQANRYRNRLMGRHSRNTMTLTLK